MTLSLTTLNTLQTAAFEQALAGIFEHSPWVPRAAAAGRPYSSVDALHAAMLAVVDEADEARQLALLCAHPDLAPPMPIALTQASASEQAGLGLDALPPDDAAWMAALNQAYRQRFGFPFIIAVRGQKDRQAILAALLARLDNPVAVEIGNALDEVGKIARFRLDDLLRDDPVPPPPTAVKAVEPQPALAGPRGWLSVHVLDTAAGGPAVGLELRLEHVAGPATEVLGRWRTDADGRVPTPLLQGAAMLPGVYQVVFDIEGWRKGAHGFYDLIPIRFRIDDPHQHYHIPLLLAPFSYSTYRGS